MTRRWQLILLTSKLGFLVDPDGKTKPAEYLTPAEAKALAQKGQR